MNFLFDMHFVSVFDLLYMVIGNVVLSVILTCRMVYNVLLQVCTCSSFALGTKIVVYPS